MSFLLRESLCSVRGRPKYGSRSAPLRVVAGRSEGWPSGELRKHEVAANIYCRQSP